MKIFPAIDLFQGKAVRLHKGNYQEMTIYHDDPAEVAGDFQQKGASYLHLVDLEGAKTGKTPNLDTISRIRSNTSLFTEVGGGIRSMKAVDTYLNAGVDRVILGTAAVTNLEFLRETVRNFRERIAVGIDLRDGVVAIRGWTEKSEYACDEFFKMMQDIGVQTVICTDISKDGAMQGVNRELYSDLIQKFDVQLIASGGVSSLDDVIALRNMGLDGAIIGKAYYTGAIDLREAIEVAL